MKHFVSRDLYAYWDGLREGRTAPERADIDPAAIRHILAYTFVLEIGGAARATRTRDVTFRLSGTRLNALFGRDLKGCSFERIWNPNDARITEAMIDGVLDDRSGVVAAARGGPRGRSPVDIEILLLPLRHHGQTHCRIFGSLVAQGAPTWMGLSAAEPLDVLGFRTLAAGADHGRPEAPQDRPPVQPSDDPWRFMTPNTARPQQIGRFTVYEGGAEDRAPR